jgi:hypothetical protein
MIRAEPVKPYDLNIVTFEAMFDGYVGAVERFEAVAEDGDPATAFVPLFEALHWVVALDERVRAHFAPGGDPLGYAWRKRIPTAEIVGGVVFARNSVHHQWSDAMAFWGGWRWRQAHELPPPGRSRTPRTRGSIRSSWRGNRSIAHSPSSAMFS